MDVSGWGKPHTPPVVGPIHQQRVTADTEKTLAVDLYAVVHLQRDADAHHLGVD